MNSKQMRKYKISDVSRFRELIYFALQYPKWRQEIEDVSLIPPLRNDGMPHGTAAISTPTENAAIRILRISDKIKAIEEAVRLCTPDPSVQKAVLKGVTTQYCTFTWLHQSGHAHCDRKTYYYARRKFYYYLDRLVP